MTLLAQNIALTFLVGLTLNKSIYVKVLFVEIWTDHSGLVAESAPLANSRYCYRS